MRSHGDARSSTYVPEEPGFSATHVDPHPLAATHSTSAIPHKTLRLVQREDSQRFRFQRNALLGHNSSSTDVDMVLKDQEQGPVARFPHIRSFELAIEQTDGLVNDITEGTLQKAFRKVLGSDDATHFKQYVFARPSNKLAESAK